MSKAKKIFVCVCLVFLGGLELDLWCRLDSVANRIEALDERVRHAEDIVFKPVDSGTDGGDS